MNQLYRMHDSDLASNPGVFQVSSKQDAYRYNAEGFGIFITVNSFNGPRRKENLERINAWAIDMDDGTKEQQRKRLHSSPLVPSFIVETKRGYQAYWFAKDARAIAWNAIVLERLVPFFGADKNARDICRILRKPGFLHLKDPKDPFPITTVWKHQVTYTERQVAQAFRWVPNKQAHKEVHREDRPAQTTVQTTDSLWDAIYQLDCEEGLRRLSGHRSVNGEQFTFQRTSSGNLNIFVDGKSSPCFIDENKRIGSPSGGGPTLVQWLRWYGHSWTHVLDTLKEAFPQLAEIDAQEKRKWIEQQRRERGAA